MGARRSRYGHGIDIARHQQLGRTRCTQGAWETAAGLFAPFWRNVGNEGHVE
jgi:hypothetical protein